MRTRVFHAWVLTVCLAAVFVAAQDKKESAPAPGPGKGGKVEKKKDVSDAELERKFEIVARVVDLVAKYYVEPVDRGKLVEGALKGILAELDPYSAYLTREDMEEMRIDLSGELQGIGVYITLDENNVLTVITPIEGTPAFKAGILSGDKILEIDGQSTRNFSLHDAVRRIRGPKGSTVTLTVYHVDLGTKETITITRDRIPIHSVKEVKMVDRRGKIGYIRLAAFQETTEQEMREALSRLVREGMKGLVLDLRDNGGGLLQAATAVADLFLDEGIIVSVKGRGGRSLGPPWKAHPEKTVTRVPVVILVNNYTASASEILAAALRDNHRAVLVGEKTFGKGSVQKLITLEDDSGIKLTIQRYYTPRGVSIDKKGLVPDIEEKMNIETKLWILEQRRRELIEKNKNEEILKKKEGKETTTTPARDPELKEVIDFVKRMKKEKKREKKFVDTQLRRAVDILKGVQVLREKLGLGAASRP